MTEAIIFDLDGTLLDTSAGIFHSVRYAEKELGLTPIPETELRDLSVLRQRKCIGKYMA